MPKQEGQKSKLLALLHIFEQLSLIHISEPRDS